MKNQGMVVKIFVILFLAASAITALMLFKPQNPFMPVTVDNEIKFETIEKKSSPNTNEKGNYVVKNVSEFNFLWNKIYSGAVIKPELPEVNFDKYMVVAVFNGIETNRGYDIEITKVGEKNNSIYVFLKKILPGNNCITSGSFVNPYHIVGFAKSEKEIYYVEKEETVNCNR